MNVIDVDVENAQATQDVLRELQIECYGREETAWAKTVVITYDDVEYEVRLNWDENDGYSTYWEGATLPHARLPEFEYVLDCITEGADI
jgi:hypothetical protein